MTTAHASELTDEMMAARTAAPWYQNAKLGVFVHWGLYSVPAWAPPVARGLRGHPPQTPPGAFDISLTPYAEWYLNSLRTEGSPTQTHHRAHYGADFDYYDFAPMFEAAHAAWRAQEWAALFAEAGARYAVLTSKHHEGYRLWPSAVENRRVAGRTLAATRDLVGDFANAMRGAGLKAGLYYSGGIDWSFHRAPLGMDFLEALVRFARDRKAGRPLTPAVFPDTPEFAAHADAELGELIERYRPDILWNDIGYKRESRLRTLLARYLELVPHGVINDRFGLAHADVETPEYRVRSSIAARKWETCRGVGASFGFNRNEGEGEMLAPFELIAMLVDVVSKNGNLLLNVGPRADGAIPANQAARLRALGAWLKENGAGIYDTVPWLRAGDVSQEGLDVRYTQSAEAVNLFVLDRRGESEVTLPDLKLGADAKIFALRDGSPVAWRPAEGGVRIPLGPDDGRASPGFRITGGERAPRAVPA